MAAVYTKSLAGVQYASSLAVATYGAPTTGKRWVIRSMWFVNQDAAAQTFTMDFGQGGRGPFWLEPLAAAGGRLFVSDVRWVLDFGATGRDKIRIGCSKINVISFGVNGYEFDV